VDENKNGVYEVKDLGPGTVLIKNLDQKFGIFSPRLAARRN